MIAAVRVPDFIRQAIEYQKDNHSKLSSVPWVVLPFGQDDGAAVVQSVSPLAQTAGVRVGGTLAQARSLCPQVQYVMRQPAWEQALQDALHDIAAAFSPLVEMHDDWTALAVSGLEHRVGSFWDVGQAIVRAGEKLGVGLFVGIARRKTLAHWLSLHACLPENVCVLQSDSGSEKAFVAELPLSVLHLSPDAMATLERFGLKNVGDFLRLPKKEISSRLGRQGLLAYNKASGTDSEHDKLLPIKPSVVFEERCAFDYAMDNLEPLAFVLRGILERLTARLQIRGYVAGTIHLRLDYESSGHVAQQIENGAPSNHVRSLLSLCRLRLADHPPTEAVIGVGLRLHPEAVRTEQLSLFEAVGPSPAELTLTVARLGALCGSGRVGVPRCVDSYESDDFKIEPAEELLNGKALGKTPSYGVNALSLRRIRPPQAAEVQVRQGLPARLRAGGQNHRVRQVWGPFKRDAGWWQKSSSGLCHYFDVETDGGRYLRLMWRQGDNTWWLEGWYD